MFAIPDILGLLIYVFLVQLSKTQYVGLKKLILILIWMGKYDSYYFLLFFNCMYKSIYYLIFHSALYNKLIHLHIYFIFQVLQLNM
jgi:hypothetical protein